MKILVSDVETAHGNACKAIIEAECPTATVIMRLESLTASVVYAIPNGYDIISRSTTGLSDSRNENEGDTAWTGGQIDSAFSSAFSSAFGGGSIQVGIVHALGSNSHVRDLDPSRLDIISAISGGDGAGNCASSYGLGLEYFYDNETAQSYATARISGIIGQIMINHPNWNFHDARQALRQTASNYASGWIEDGGYGYVDKADATALSSLDLSSPIRKEYTLSDGLIEFAWISNPQTDFSNTVIAMFETEPTRSTVPTSAQIIYAGALEEFEYQFAFNQAKWIAFYTRNSGLDYSLVENNPDASYWFDKIELNLVFQSKDVSCEFTDINDITCELTDINNISATFTEV